jgi:hypothetical protein
MRKMELECKCFDGETAEGFYAPLSRCGVEIFM